MKKYHFYELGPIDWWEGWQYIGDYVAHSQKEMQEFCSEMAFDLTGFIVMVAKLAAKFKQIGWEGDVTGKDFFVSGLPTDDCTAELMFAIKQPNNGQVYVASPYSLPWLKEYEKK